MSTKDVKRNNLSGSGAVKQVIPAQQTLPRKVYIPRPQIPNPGPRRLRKSSRLIGSGSGSVVSVTRLMDDGSRELIVNGRVRKKRKKTRNTYDF